MSVPTWPAALPRPRRSGWQAQFADPRLKRQADTGMPGARRRWSKAARQVSLTLTVTRDERAVFDRFFEHELKHGSKPFRMPDPTTDGWAMLAGDGTPLLTPHGQPLLLSGSWLCVFGEEMPSETIEGVRFTLSLNIWVMP